MKRFKILIGAHPVISIFAGVLLCVLSAVAALPSLVSTSYVRAMLTEQASVSLGRSVSIDALSLSWALRLHLSGVRVAESEEFGGGDFARLDVLDAHIPFFALLGDKPKVEFEASGLAFNHVRLADGRTNIDAFLSGVEEAPAPLWQSIAGTFATLYQAFPLPPQAAIQANIASIALAAKDLKSGRSVQLQKGSVSFGFLGYGTPLKFAVKGNLSLDEIPATPLGITAQLENLLTEKGLVPALARLSADVLLPGMLLNASGSLAEGLDVNFRADLAECLKLAGPFLPSNAPSLAGDLKFDSLTVVHETKAEVEAIISGHGIAAQGVGVPKGLPALDFRMGQRAVVDVSKQTIVVDSGRFDLREILSTGWKLAYDDRVGSTLATLENFVFMPKKLMAVVEAYLPDGLELGLTEPQLSAERVIADVQGNRMKVVLGDLEMRCDDFSVLREGQSVAAKNVRFGLESLESNLADLLPANVRMKASFGADAVQVRQGKDTLASLDRLSFSKLEAVVPKISLGMSLGIDAEIKADAQIDSVAASGLNLGSAKTALGARVSLNGNVATVRSLENTISFAGLRLPNGLFIEASNASTKGQTIRVPLNSPALADVEGLAIKSGVDGVASLNVDIDAERGGQQSLRVRCSGDADIAKALLLARVADISAAGQSQFSMDFDGRLPTDAEVAALSADILSELRKDGALPFIRSFDVQSSTQALHYRQPDMELGGAESSAVFELRLREGIRQHSLKARYQGGVRLVQENADIAFPVLMRMEAEGKGLSRVRFNESVAVESFGISQQAEFEFKGVDRALSHLSEGVLPSLLRYLRGGGRFLVESDASKLGAFGVEASGLSRFGAKFSLDSRGVSLTLDVDAKKVDVTLPGLAAWGANADFSLARRLPLLEKGDVGISGLQASYLSDEVLAPLQGRKRENSMETAADTWLKRLSSDLQGGLGDLPWFSVDAVEMKGGALPLTIRNILGRLDLEHDPGLKFFRSTVLDGTIEGGLRFVEADGEWRLRSATGFTNVDAARLLPPDVALDAKSAKVSGRLYLDVPVGADPLHFLRDSIVRVEFTSIGSGTLDRMLRSLDPYESNEAIVSQRKMLELGGPRTVLLDIERGGLSLKGTVYALGMVLNLPPVTGVNVESLPIAGKLGEALAPMDTVAAFLNLWMSDGLVIDGETVRPVRVNKVGR